jgi:hypothetical protein
MKVRRPTCSNAKHIASILIPFLFGFIDFDGSGKSLFANMIGDIHHV